MYVWGGEREGKGLNFLGRQLSSLIPRRTSSLGMKMITALPALHFQIHHLQPLQLPTEV